MQKEIQEAGAAGYRVAGQIVFESLFGGKETAAILEKSGESKELR
jgi:hypothetical protein